MRRILPVLLAALAAGCAYHSPTAPTVVTVPPSTTAASIRLNAASRPDRSTDVVATVLTAEGNFVSGAAVTFTTTAGTLSATSGTSDTLGVVRSVLTSGATATVRAQAAGLTSDLSIIGTPPAADPTTGTPSTPLPPAVVPPPVLTVTINPGSATLGTATSFGLATQALSKAVWDFGDGSTAITAGATTHTYATVGTFPVVVTVTDTIGRTASSNTTATVAAAPVVAPTAPAGLVVSLGCTPVAHGSATACNIIASNNGTVLQSALITNVAWDWGDGSTTATGIPTSSRSYVNAGTYPVFATVSVPSISATTQTTSKQVIIP